jgi:hypothetical protein
MLSEQGVQQATTEPAESISQSELVEQEKPQEQSEPTGPVGETEPSQQSESTKQVEQLKQTEQVSAQESTKILEAQQKLMFAQHNFKMAQKGILGYSQVVALCRGVIQDYPDTEYAQQALDLLRQIPEDQRAQYNLTDEELESD